MPDGKEYIPPRCNSYLLGHEAEEKKLLDAFKDNSLHNSWIISGVKGIGKATFAYKFARVLLNDDGRLVSQNSHPDLKIIERDYTDTDKRKIMKAIKDGQPLDESDLSGLKKSSFIRVDDVRTINEFLSKRSSNDGWRVVVIDSVDEMNSASANAVLKILEEPPYKTVMLLVSHNPNKLLPTIKSRCAKLQLKPLNDDIVASLLRRYRPDVKEAEVKEIAKISGGSIGKAIDYVDCGALKSYQELCKIIYAKDKFLLKDLMNFADVNEYELAKELILKFISENVRSCSSVEDMADVWDKALSVFSETEGLNLDKKQALINVINSICKVI